MNQNARPASEVRAPFPHQHQEGAGGIGGPSRSGVAFEVGLGDGITDGQRLVNKIGEGHGEGAMIAAMLVAAALFA